MSPGIIPHPPVSLNAQTNVGPKFLQLINISKKKPDSKGSLQKKKTKIYWSFTNRGYSRPRPPPLARIGNFSFFLRLFSRGGGHNWEKNFIHFLHVSEHIDHF